MFLLAWALALLATCCHGYRVSEKVLDEVTAGEARYYSVDTPGLVIVALLSVEGDADIYASTTNRQPSHDSYEFGVASCGLDLLVLPAQRANKKVYLGVHGHIRHPNTTYLLFVILPDQEDIRRYQVWDWDHESQSQRLLIDVDSLLVANDPTLHTLLEEITVGKRPSESGGMKDTLKTIAEWGLWLLLKTLELIVEVLA